MEAPQPKRVEFKLHQNLLNHLVDRQAATPEKALIELVMNAADAGASRVDIVLSDIGFEISDNGSGFKSEQDIENFFATFGTPQETEKTFGRFRVGRAQIFGWASAVWESNAFRMAVDFGKDAQGFTLSELTPPRPGCHIMGVWRARPADTTSLDPRRLRAALQSGLRFPPVEVWINGDLLALPLADCEWTSENDLGYFRLATTGPLRVYNQGVFVCEICHSTYHVGGIVVSKKALDLTMARDWPLMTRMWMDIGVHLKKQAKVLHASGASVGTEEFRAYMLRQVLDGEGDLNSEVITTVPKRQERLLDWVDSLRTHRALVYASRGNLSRVESVLRETGIKAATLHFDTVERARRVLGLSSDSTEESVVFALLEAVQALAGAKGMPLPSLTIYDADALPEPVGAGELLARIELTPDEKRFCTSASNVFAALAKSIGDEPARKVFIARTRGDVVAFTDGRLFVAVSRPLVERVLSQTRGALVELVMTLVHELCHRADSRNAGHDDVFYQTYHRYTCDGAAAIERAIWAMGREVRKIRPADSLKTGLVREATSEWWRPDITPMSDREIARFLTGTAKNALTALNRGEVTSKQYTAIVTGAQELCLEWGSHKALEPYDLVARPLRLAGPFMSLLQREAPDRRPTRRMLEAFQHGRWEQLNFEVDSCFDYGGLADVHFGGHQIGELCIKAGSPKARRLEWEAVPEAPQGFEQMFMAFATECEDAFPWEKRDFKRDLAWVMLARVSLQVWEYGPRHRWNSRVYGFRGRRPSDPPASAITVYTDLGLRERPVGDPTPEWKRGLASAIPGIVEVSGSQLKEEALAAFERDAADVVDDATAASFWLTWSTN